MECTHYEIRLTYCTVDAGEEGSITIIVSEMALESFQELEFFLVLLVRVQMMTPSI